MRSLFPQSSAHGAAANVLVEFPAGKCNISNVMPNGKHQVTPDARRGKIMLTRGNDGLIHFKWANAVTGVVEDDRMLFPGENVFKKVKTGRPSDRVFMLKYLTGNQRLMYWMQSVSDEKDQEHVKKVNDLIENPNSGTTGQAAGPNDWMQMMGLNAPAEGIQNNAPFAGLDFGSLLNNTTRANNPTSANIPPPVPAQPSLQQQSAPITIEDLQRAMFPNLPPPRNNNNTQQQETPDLQDILIPEDIINSGVLDDPQTRQELSNLLPSEQQANLSDANRESLLQETIRSAQFQQAVGSLSHAVQNLDNFQSVASNFNLDPQAGMNNLLQNDGVGAFLTSLQSSNPPITTSSNNNGDNNNSNSDSDKKKKDDSTPMDEE